MVTEIELLILPDRWKREGSQDLTLDFSHCFLSPLPQLQVILGNSGVHKKYKID